MTFMQRAALVLFAAFFVSTIATSVAGYLLAAPVMRALTNRAAATRASVLAFYRVLPSIAALAITAFVLAPGYVRHEQRDELEAAGVALVACAAGGLLILLRSLARVVRALLATSALRRQWLRAGVPLRIDGVGMPAFAIDLPFPLVAVLGVVRPRLFISSSVLKACSPDELRAIVDHERRHVSAFDNATRLLMDAAPDALGGTAMAGALGSMWHQAVEYRADDAAGRRLDLASALVRVARLAGNAPPVVLPASALYRGDGIDDRVRRLVREAPDASDGSTLRCLALAASVLAVAIAAAASNARASEFAHALLEAVVSLP